MLHRFVLIGSMIVSLSAAGASAQVLQHEAVDPAASLVEISPSFQKFLETLIDNYNDLANDADAKVVDRECESDRPLNCDFTLGDKARLSTYFASPLEYVVELETTTTGIVPDVLKAIMAARYSKSARTAEPPSGVLEAVLEKSALHAMSTQIDWTVNYDSEGRIYIRARLATCAKYRLCS